MQTKILTIRKRGTFKRRLRLKWARGSARQTSTFDVSDYQISCKLRDDHTTKKSLSSSPTALVVSSVTGFPDQVVISLTAAQTAALTVTETFSQSELPRLDLRVYDSDTEDDIYSEQILVRIEETYSHD